MRVAILVFSPSGNTLAVAGMLETALRKSGAEAQVVDATRAEGLGNGHDTTEWLAQHVPPHDVLCVGAPVYARHFQYRALELIEALPAPGGPWGSLAVPFATYGAITSGIALEEAGERLAASGRTVVAGLKVSAAHCMTGPMLGFVLNEGRPGVTERALARELADRILGLSDASAAPDALDDLRYQDRAYKQASVQDMDERRAHEERFPALRFDQEDCTRCGACVARCPVQRLTLTSGGVSVKAGSDCIHCLQCLSVCPSGAAALEDGEKFRAFLGSIVEKNGHAEQPGSSLFPAGGEV